jgi:hypothetical protein
MDGWMDGWMDGLLMLAPGSLHYQRDAKLID